MSKITIEKLRDAEAFLDQFAPKSIQEQYDHITCTIKKSIESLDDLSSYDSRHLIKLINTTVNFRNIEYALGDLIERLRAEQEESEA